MAKFVFIFGILSKIVHCQDDDEDPWNEEISVDQDDLKKGGFWQNKVPSVAEPWWADSDNEANNNYGVQYNYHNYPHGGAGGFYGKDKYGNYNDQKYPKPVSNNRFRPGANINIKPLDNGMKQMNWDNVTQTINSFFKNKFPSTRDGKSSYTDIEILTCYGCWCNRGEFFGQGMGIPRDPFDAACKFHHQAYECIEIDAAARGEVCDPAKISEEGFNVKTELTFVNGRGGMTLQCDHEQDWCRQRTCEADIQYIKDFVRTALAGHTVRRDLYGHASHIDQSTGRPTGNFDNLEKCPLGGNLHTPYKQCCGAYPRRRVYKTDKLEGIGYRECCDIEGGDNDGSTDGQVYYPNRQVCCGTGGVENGDSCSNDGM